MRLIERFWKALTNALSVVSLFPYGHEGAQQVPLLAHTPTPQHQVHISTPSIIPTLRGGPTFPPPGNGRDSSFECKYPSMKGYRFCSTPEDRSCWLVNDENGDRFDIRTDYETRTPVGITRTYNLNTTDSKDPVSLDGLPFPKAKLFNNTYPGPWLQACWGDRLQIRIDNKLLYNGTSIHWHGIRQYRTMHMDGVNGVTQCPIKPGDSFLYDFTATQYGSSWYHSHYSLQYADGLVGPLTIHGPTSAPFDEPADIPLLMTDWTHNSAFDAIYRPPGGPGPLNPSILLNGRGNVTRYSGVKSTVEPLTPYTLVFENRTSPGPKRYLLRIINTSYLSTFVFSIDNHYLTVVTSDFVPIHPYSNTSILVGIGQRYNVIVTAAPQLNLQGPIPADGNFWIRTYVAFCSSPRGQPPLTSSDCSQLNGHTPGYERSGILRYNASSKTDPGPDSKPWLRMSCACSDETYTSLRPIVPWQVSPPSNGAGGEELDVVLNTTSPQPYQLSAFSLRAGNAPFSDPLQINYSDPTFLHLDNTGGWNKSLVVIPEDYTDNDWVYLIIAGDRTGKTPGQTTGAHPIHLHGHDFAILQQAEGRNYSNTTFKPKLDNPPRRDVVLLPRDGFVVIAFRTDNPGAWLMHCHIANHASEGLAVQILERRSDADLIWPSSTSPAIAKARGLCNNWKAWQSDCKNWQGGCGSLFQDDSGI